MAKGVEDTAFYRWHRLVALNEVGGDPTRLGVTPAVPRPRHPPATGLAGHNDHATPTGSTPTTSTTRPSASSPEPCSPTPTSPPTWPPSSTG
jgi:hypothetical protein